MSESAAAAEGVREMPFLEAGNQEKRFDARGRRF